jgi:hypothetical protein
MGAKGQGSLSRDLHRSLRPRRAGLTGDGVKGAGFLTERLVACLGAWPVGWPLRPILGPICCCPPSGPPRWDSACGVFPTAQPSVSFPSRKENTSTRPRQRGCLPWGVCRGATVLSVISLEGTHPTELQSTESRTPGT